ncbi:DUF6020 family protein [Bifidobacterium aquikefiricola]|uniref:DUF6020 family protein n=1 Tax=Bifidobacterium aquikefiricola TaxID=3059038 RepID=A0AB39U8A8_9BIFI
MNTEDSVSTELLKSHAGDRKNTSLKPQLESRFRSIDVYAALFSLCMSALLVLGVFVLDHVFSPQFQIVGASSFALLVVIAVVGSIPLYLLTHWLFLRIDVLVARTHEASSETDTSAVLNSTKSEQKHVGFSALLARAWLKYSSLILLGWVPYFLIRFPGNIDSDTYWELEQVYGLVPRNDQHPYFDTLVFGAFWRLGDIMHSHFISLLLYALIQMIVTAAVLGLALCYMRYIGVPRSMTRVSLIFLSTFPIIPFFAETMAKDMLFGWVWVLFLLGVMEAARSRGNALRIPWFLIGFSVTVLLLMLTKKTGVYLALGTIVIMLVFLKNRVRLLCSLLIPLMLFLGVWTSALLPRWNVTPGPEREMLAVPSQQTAMYIKRNSANMTRADWKVLSRVFHDPQSLPLTYTPARGDNTKGRWIEDASRADKEAFVLWWMEHFFKDPGSYMLATAANTLPLYYPDISTEGSESTLFYGDKITPQGQDDNGLIDTLINYSGGKATRADILELMGGTNRYPAVSTLSTTFNTWYLNMTRAFPIVFSKVLYTTWIPFFALAYCLRRHQWLGVLCMVPAMLTLCTLFISPIAIPRYLVPVIYTAPLTLGCLFIGVNARRMSLEGLNSNRIDMDQAK